MRATAGTVTARVTAVVAAAAALGLAGCTGSDAPTDASPEEFCDVFLTLSEARDGADFRRFAESLARTGTPADISDAGRGGFEVVVRVGRSLDADATLDELEDPNVSDMEEQEAQAFFEYGSESCASLDDADGAL